MSSPPAAIAAWSKLQGALAEYRLTYDLPTSAAEARRQPRKPRGSA